MRIERLIFMDARAVDRMIGRGMILMTSGLCGMLLAHFVFHGRGLPTALAVGLAGGSTARLRPWKQERGLWMVSATFLAIMAPTAVGIACCIIPDMIADIAKPSEMLRDVDILAMAAIWFWTCRMLATVTRVNFAVSRRHG